MEAHFHPRSANARARLWDLLGELDVEVLDDAADPVFLERVFAWLRKYQEHEPDWADASIAVLSGGHGQSVDVRSEFRTRWRKPNGRLIPLNR